MKLKELNVRKTMFLITYTIILLVVGLNYQTVFSFISYLLGALTPVFIGLTMAFIINLLVNYTEKTIFKKLKEKRPRLCRGVAIIFSVLFFILMIMGLILLVVPELMKSVTSLIDNLPRYLAVLDDGVRNFLIRIGASYETINSVNISIDSLEAGINNYLANNFNQIFNITTSILVAAFNIFLGLIIAIYVLIDKDNLIKGLKKGITAYLPPAKSEKIIRASKIITETFNGFVAAGLVMAVIVGVMCFIMMTILNMPYPVLISVIMAVTNLIPVFGLFMGIIPSFLIILMVSPESAILFLILQFIIAQIQSSMIFPRLLGKTIGLPGLWVLISIIVGGALMGIIGMILAIPIVSLIYISLKADVEKKLQKPKALQKVSKSSK